MAKKLQLGSRTGLLLELTPDQQRKNSGLIWGEGRLLVGEHPVIAGEAGGGVSWTWVDLLEWFGKQWSWLLLEQDFPFQVPALDITTLMRDLEKRWENMPEARAEDEEEEAYRFLGRHDLASAFKGIFFPSVYLMRQGDVMEITSVEHASTWHLPFHRMVEDLEQIGHGLAELAVGEPGGRGSSAASQWQARLDNLKAKALPILTGLPEESLARINPGNDPDYWEYSVESPLADGELMAAARMSNGVLSLEQQATVIEMIRHTGRSGPEKLDALTTALFRDFREVGKPHDQGYWAANWLRQKLQVDDEKAVVPAALLREWGVQLKEFEMPGSKLDALACWGKCHGPAVFINKATDSTPVHIHGENSTLAHEICHLLMDRKSGLPVAEVMNGNSPERLEKRARAFAAELLLPRHVAAGAARQSDSLERVITELSEHYKVSVELVSWQIINSDLYTTLTHDEQRWLNTLKR